MITYVVSELGLMFLGGRLGAAGACRSGRGNTPECDEGTGRQIAAEEGAMTFIPSFSEPEKKQNRLNVSKNS